MRLFLLFLLLPIYVIAANLGTKEEPLEIDNVQDLVWIRDAINSGSGTFKGVDISNGAPNIYFKLMNDVDLQSPYISNTYWTPIGTEKHPFMGNFDGNGKTIDYLVVNIAYNVNSIYYYGLFGYVKNPEIVAGMPIVTTIQKLTIGEHSLISVPPNRYVGGIAGYAKNDVQFINCINKAALSGGKTLGGIVGYVDYAGGVNGFRIKNCENLGSIDSYETAGGIIGEAKGAPIYIDSCKNSASISANNYAAGIVGSATSTQLFSPVKIQYCVNTGYVYSASSPAGGITAQAINVLFNNDFNSGKIEAVDAAGISATLTNIAFTSATQKFNVNAGVILADSNAGGIFGYIQPNSDTTLITIDENLNLGLVKGKYVGGIVGYTDTSSYSIVNNMNAGTIDGNYEGSIVGYLNNSFTSKISVKNNLNVGATDSLESDDPRGAIIGTIANETKYTTLDSSVNDRQMNPYCAVYTSVYCKDYTADLSTKDLIAETLPEFLDNDIWEAKEGYYPELKSLKNSALAEIASASALAITPVTFDTLNSIWDFNLPAATKATDGIGTTLSIASANGGLLVNGTTITPYNAGFDTILVSNNVATKKIPVKNNITGTLGTAANPLTIASVSELYAFKKAVEDSSNYKGVTLKNAGEGLYFKLTADLNLSKTCVEGNDSWQTIKIFTGSFNGGNHIISSMCINDDDTRTLDASGLFANTIGAQGSDTTVFENIIFESTRLKKSRYIVAGALIGRIISGNTIIRNISVKKASFNVTADTSYSSYVGGVVGMNLGNTAFYNNEAAGTIDVKYGEVSIGGVIGAAIYNSRIFDNVSHVNIHADSTKVSYLGGITGEFLQGDILERNTNYGDIVADSILKFSFVGGIAGIVPVYKDIELSGNKNYGNNNFTGPQSNIGGIFGQLNGSNTKSISDLENYGNIIVNETNYTISELNQGGIGGIIGFAANINSYKNLKNEGSITSHKKVYSYIGGVIGIALSQQNIAASELQNNGDIQFTNGLSHDQAFIGGIIGYASPTGTLTISDVLNNGNLSSDESHSDYHDSFIAGIIGGASVDTSFTISSTTNNGNITSKSSYETQLGGLVGLATMDYATNPTFNVLDSRNKGSITLEQSNDGYNYVMVGGLAAIVAAMPQISNSENLGNITVFTDSKPLESGDEYFYLGGIIALAQPNKPQVEMNLLNVFNSGNIQAKIHDEIDTNSTSSRKTLASGVIANAVSVPGGRAENIANYGSINIHCIGSSYASEIFGYLNATKTFTMRNILAAGAINIDVSESSKVGAFAGYATNASITSAIAYGSNGIAGFALDAIGATTLSNGSSTNTLDSVVFDQQMTAQENEDEINLYATTELTKLGLVDKLNDDDWVKKDNLYPELKIFAESESTFVSEISAIAATPIYLANTMDTTEYTNGVGYSFKVETSNSPLWESSVEGLVIEDSIANISGIDSDTFAVLTASSENASKQFFLRLTAHEKDTLDLTQVAWNYTDPFEYDGTEKTVTVTGLPEGVTAVYTNNSDSLPGSYSAEVSFIYNDTLYVKPAFDSTLTWEIEKKTITLDSIVWDYTAMFDYDSSAKAVSLKNVPEEIQVDYVNNVQSDSGRYVAQALLRYDSNKYTVEGDTAYKLVWMISYDSTKVVASSSSEAESSSSSIVDESSSSSEDAESSSSSEKVNIAMTHQVIAVQLVKNGRGNYTLNFASGSAASVQIQVFDLMGNRIPVEINRNGSSAELKGLPQNSPSLIKVRGKSTRKTFKVL